MLFNLVLEGHEHLTPSELKEVVQAVKPFPARLPVAPVAFPESREGLLPEPGRDSARGFHSAGGKDEGRVQRNGAIRHIPVVVRAVEIYDGENGLPA